MNSSLLPIEYPRPNLVISKCIEFDSCRYNGQQISHDLVRQMKELVHFIPVCPEVEVGLGVPRMPVRLAMIDKSIHMIQPSSGQDLTVPMNSFSETFLLGLKDVDGFILKHKSPSCGPGQVRVYTGEDPGAKGAGVATANALGLFAQAIKNRFPNHPVEDEGRLLNYGLRETYLSRIYTMARFRQVSEAGTISALIAFHAHNKFLLMVFNEPLMRSMGKLVANAEHKPVEQVIDEYRNLLLLCLDKNPRRTSIINVMQHMAGFFSKLSSPLERQFFDQTLLLYREERIPLTSVVAVIEAWALRHGTDYLLAQTILAPYPHQLRHLVDSGRHLNL